MRTGLSPRRLVGAIAVALVASALAASPSSADHLESIIGPNEPAREFPKQFMRTLPVDKQQEIAAMPAWQDPHVGGWGGGEAEGCSPGRKIERTPVVFVHGNTEDAWFWHEDTDGDGATVVDVRKAFLAAGYCPIELWAISYTGAPGYTTYNDINTEEVYDFIQAVRKYTHSDQVDVVAHSLGVTVVRKAAFEHRELYSQMASFVAIAGANDGTTSCRGAGEAHVSHVCEEVYPGSPWLDELNSIGEAPAGPRYLTIYEGTGTTDQFYLGPDAKSPQLEGACNVELPFTAHYTLARGQAAVDIYLPFLRDGKQPECVQ